MVRCAVPVLLGLLAVSGRAEAGPLLSGSVLFDPANRLYTYSYTLDNPAAPAPVYEVSVLINSATADPSFPHPVHTGPPAWNFFTAVSGGIADPPYNMFGTFWQWEGTGASASDLDAILHFSFTTPRAPTTRAAHNYFPFSGQLANSSADGNGILEYGHIVAPDFALAPQAAPEPATLTMAWLGLAGMGWVALRKRYRLKSARQDLESA